MINTIVTLLLAFSFLNPVWADVQSQDLNANYGVPSITPNHIQAIQQKDIFTRHGYTQIAKAITPKREVVRRVQSLLSQLGYNPGTIDGTMGQKTRNAIRAFQRQSRMPTTGEISEDLLHKLNIAVRELKTDGSKSDISLIAKKIAEEVGSVKNINLKGTKGPIFVFEEFHTSRVGQLQIAIMLLRLHV
jgi:hypothetical protein